MNRADWYALRNLLDPYLDSRDGKLVPPDEIDPLPLPEHLVDYPVAKFVQKYRATGKSRYLDRTGETLVPLRDPRQPSASNGIFQVVMQPDLSDFTEHSPFCRSTGPIRHADEQGPA